MDVNNVFSVGDSSQSVRIAILLVNDDRTCKNVVEEMLEHCSYQVLHAGGIKFDVIKAIWEEKDSLDLVLTNADKFSDGDEIFKHIEETLHLRVIPICLDERKTESKGQIFAAYILNGLSIDCAENIWQYAVEKVKHKMEAAHKEEKVQRASISNVAVEINRPSSSNSDAARLKQKRKGIEPSEGSKDDHHPAKKTRVKWTHEMHQKFVKAIDILGYEKAVPKKIVELLKVDFDWLTRENVASHLQKYRGSMKRTQETEFQRLGVFSPPSTSRLNSLQTHMTAFPGSSYMPTARESVSPSKSQYLKTRKDFSFDTTSERQIYYTSIGNLLFSDRTGLDKLQKKHDPELQLTPNFRIYGDQRSEVLLLNNNISLDISNQSNINTFVGFRFTSDGNFEYGNIRASIDKISSEAVVSTPGNSGNQFTSYVQNSAILDQNSLMSTAVVSQQLSLVGCPAGETSYQCQPVSGIPGNENPTESITVASVIRSFQEVALLSSDENLFILDPSTPLGSTSNLDQDASVKCRETPANAAPFQKPPEKDVRVENPSTSSSLFPCDNGFSLGTPVPVSDFQVQSPAAFLEGITEHHSSSPLPQMLEYFDEFFD